MTATDCIELSRCLAGFVAVLLMCACVAVMACCVIWCACMLCICLVEALRSVYKWIIEYVLSHIS